MMLTYDMLHSFLFVLSLVSFVIGAYVGWLGYRAYKKDEDRVLLTLCSGFLLIALSNFFEDFILKFFGWEVVHAHLVRIPLFTLGMAVILYSLKMKP